MYNIILNGQNQVIAEDMNLLDFLRDSMRLTAAKNGCGEGACGACMVLVDGKAMRACLLTVSKVTGKKVITVEGVSPHEQEIYALAFGAAGAVQCGFCTPGMIISAKGLLDTTLSPTPVEIKQALRGNLCRCTGYIKIEKAVLLAAKALREGVLPMIESRSGIGNSLIRVDAKEKALGIGQYVDDVQVENMLYGAVLRTKYPRALIKDIDVTDAKAHPGVVAVLTATDIPGQRYWGFIVKDWPTLVAIGEETRCSGDALVLVAAKTKQAARAAVALIKVTYEERVPVKTPTEALAKEAPQIHAAGNVLSTTVIHRGNAEEAILQAAYVVTHRYTTPVTEHAFLEPESALAVPTKEGGLTIYVSSQSVFEDQHGIMATLNLPSEKVRVISKLVGGAFGGKEDLSVQHHAALLAWHTKQPVKLTLTRKQSLLMHPKRHAMELEVTTACDAHGKITAIKAVILADTGAYSSLGGPVLQRACTHIGGPYHIENVDIMGQCVYTNNPPGGAFRGFGVPQAAFAGESNMDRLAQKIGLSPWEIRYRNVVEPGMALPNGQIADEGTAIKESLLSVRKAYEENPYAGIACTLKNTGIGVGLPDISRVKLLIQQGKVLILTSAACIGQGLATIVTQMVCETTGLDYTLVTVHAPDTAMTPDAGTTTASRQTLFTGEATRQAALKLNAALQQHALSELEGQEYYGEYFGQTDPINSDKKNPSTHVAFSYATHVVILDEEGRVQKVVAAHDIGRAINPLAIEGQIEGAVAMGLGYALTEKFPIENCVPTAKFGTLGLLRSIDMPEIETMIIEKNQSPLAYGAKGVGEIATIPVAPAVASAYYKLDGKMRDSLPLQDTYYKKDKETVNASDVQLKK